MCSRARSSAPRISMRVAPWSIRRLASAGVMVGRLMEDTPYTVFLGLGVAAIELLEIAEQQFGARLGDAVPKRLAVAPKVDEPLLAHLGEMLRGGGLRQPCRVGQRADTALAPLHQLAQHHQPPLVGESSEDAGHHGGVGLKRGEVGGSAGHCEALSLY